MSAPVVVPSAAIGILPDAWRQCVGTGRMNLALRADYRASLALVQQEIGFRYIRGHGLLSDDVGIHRNYDAAGYRGTRYAFTYADQIIDALLDLGIAPFLELGFMPAALSSGPQTVFWWKGNVTPPADHAEWVRLVQALLRHLIERYGIAQVRTWPIEIWNEPDLPQFWQGADAGAYHRLYEASVLAIKEVDAGLRVGGPALSPGGREWWLPFADFIAARDLPADFLSFHAYASGPAQHVPFGVYQTLRRSSDLLEQFAHPARALAGTVLEGVPLHVTEFNTSYRPDNPVHDSAANAAYLAPVLAAGGDLVESFSYWTFCDVFEEEGIPAALFHGGFGMLTHRQIKKPTFHLYAFMARLGTEVLAHGDDHLVTRHADGRIASLVWQPVGGTDDPEEPARHELSLSVPCGGASAAVYLRRADVDEHRGNAFTAWRELGRPASPTRRQEDALREAAEPVRSHAALPVREGRVRLDIVLERHGIALLELDAVHDETPDWIDDARILGRGL